VKRLEHKKAFKGIVQPQEKGFKRGTYTITNVLDALKGLLLCFKFQKTVTAVRA
jgi:hypothetical protein